MSRRIPAPEKLISRITRLLNEAIQTCGDQLADAVSFTPEAACLTVAGNEVFIKENRVLIVGWGKSCCRMVSRIHAELEPHRTVEVLCLGNEEPLSRMTYLECSHEGITPHKLKQTERFLDLLSSKSIGCTVLCVASGGASSMLTQPIRGLAFSDKRRIVESLGQAGFDCRDRNLARYSLSAVKRGGLLFHLQAASQLVTFVISDDVLSINTGEDPSAFVSSGLTSVEPWSEARSLRLLDGVGLDEHVRQILETSNQAKRVRLTKLKVLACNLCICDISKVMAAVQSLFWQTTFRDYTNINIVKDQVWFGDMEQCIESLLTLIPQGIGGSVTGVCMGGEAHARADVNPSGGGPLQHLSCALLQQLSRRFEPQLEEAIVVAVASDSVDNLDGISGAALSLRALGPDALPALDVALRNYTSTAFLRAHDGLITQAFFSPLNLGDVVFVLCFWR